MLSLSSIPVPCLPLYYPSPFTSWTSIISDILNLYIVETTLLTNAKGVLISMAHIHFFFPFLATPPCLQIRSAPPPQWWSLLTIRLRWKAWLTSVATSAENTSPPCTKKALEVLSQQLLWTVGSTLWARLFKEVPQRRRHPLCGSWTRSWALPSSWSNLSRLWRIF